MEVPAEYDGLGLGKTSALGVEEQLTRLGGFGVTYGAHCGIGTLPIVYFGTEAQKKEYLPKLATGEWMAAYALSEAGTGSDAPAPKATPARRRHWVLNGTKMWITNAASPDVFTIFAKVDGQHFSAFIVERTSRASPPARKRTSWASSALPPAASFWRCPCRWTACWARSARGPRSPSAS